MVLYPRIYAYTDPRMHFIPDAFHHTHNIFKAQGSKIRGQENPEEEEMQLINALRLLYTYVQRSYQL